MSSPTKPLTRADEAEVFRIATRGLVRRYAEKLKAGMSDEGERWACPT